MKRAVIIEPDASVRPIFIAADGSHLLYELGIIHSHIRGFAEPIQTTQPNFTVYVDGHAIRKKLPPNRLASDIFTRSTVAPELDAIIFGPALILGAKDNKGSPTGLTPEQTDIFLSPSGEDILNALTEPSDA